MIPGLPDKHSIAGAIGLASTNAIAVPGIKSGDTLLAIIKHSGHGATPEAASGVVLASFSVGNGTITSSGGGAVNLSGYKLIVIWAHRN